MSLPVISVSSHVSENALLQCLSLVCWVEVFDLCIFFWPNWRALQTKHKAKTSSPWDANSFESLSDNISVVFQFTAQSWVSQQIPGNTKIFKVPIERDMYSVSLNTYSGQVLLWFCTKEGSCELQFPQRYSVFISKGVWHMKLSNKHPSSQADKAKCKFHGKANA